MDLSNLKMNLSNLNIIIIWEEQNVVKISLTFPCHFKNLKGKGNGLMGYRPSLKNQAKRTRMCIIIPSPFHIRLTYVGGGRVTYTVLLQTNSKYGMTQNRPVDDDFFD